MALDWIVNYHSNSKDWKIDIYRKFNE